MSLAPDTCLGPYEITAQIGAGGLGEVYRATDTKLNRDVAVKVLPSALAAHRAAEGLVKDEIAPTLSCRPLLRRKNTLGMSAPQLVDDAPSERRHQGTVTRLSWRLDCAAVVMSSRPSSTQWGLSP